MDLLGTQKRLCLAVVCSSSALWLRRRATAETPKTAPISRSGEY
jgi:hypothetical protein